LSFKPFHRVLATLEVAACCAKLEEYRLCSSPGESEALNVVLRELLYGVRSKPTHRAVFELRNDEVIVHSIRHLAQRDLTPQDLE
jgi:hypothetical protein